MRGMKQSVPNSVDEYIAAQPEAVRPKLEANPLVDIRNVAHIENVVVRGKLVTKQAIDKILASHRRASGAK
jgi:hypothetical protein